MLFTDFKYFIFLALVLIVFQLTINKSKWITLLVASIVFYAFANPWYLVVIALVIFINYYCGLFIDISETKAKKKQFLVLSVVLNVLILVFFKYFNFFAGTAFVLLKYTGLNYAPDFLKILMPLGISFYIFQVLSYQIDIFRGVISSEKHFGYYSLSVIFFPKLISGPIERSKNYIPQLRALNKPNTDDVVAGLKLLLWGLFKKVVIADRLANYVNPVFDSYQHYSGINLILASVFYAIQVYADFSGYTDMALGSARLMGIRLMQNFNRPYFARSISDFWRRWHISLSTWILDYLYTPINFRKRRWGMWSVSYALLIAFFLCGLWHGPSWNYALWGLLHGIALNYDFMTNNFRKKIINIFPVFIRNSWSVLTTFVFIVFSLILFRTTNLHQYFYFLKNLFVFDGDYSFHHLAEEVINKPGLSHLEFMVTSFYLIIFVVIEACLYKMDEVIFFTKIRPIMKWSLYLFLVFSIGIFGVFSQKYFIYFNF